LKLGSFSKLEPIYCGLFEVLDKTGPIAYKIASSTNNKSHDVFYVSLLKKYVHDLNQVIDYDMIYVEGEGEFEIDPLNILDRK